MKVEFLRFETEDGLLLQALLYLPEKETKKAFLHIHGMAGNFYENRFVDAMAEQIADADCAFFAINTRGHDFIADIPVVGDKEKFKRIGNAYEIFTECLFDIKGAMRILQQRGYEEVILCGHSLGSSKVVYYLAKEKNPLIKKLILMSPADMVGLARTEENHQELLSLSEKMVAEGRGNELLPGVIWGWAHLSAKTYVDANTPGNAVDIINTYAPEAPTLLNHITVPTLVFFGEKDYAVIGPIPEMLEVLKKKLSSAPKVTTAIIPQASHGYFGKENEMVQVIVNWLKK